jgi:hypothetical protein
MNLSNETLGFLIMSSEDPSLVAEALKWLPPDTHVPETRAALPTSWVISQTRLRTLEDPKLRGEYAIRHCHDPATLDSVAKYTRNIAIAQSIIRNPLTSSSTVDWLANESPLAANDAIQRELERRVERLLPVAKRLKALSLPLDSYIPNEIADLLIEAAEIGAAQEIDELISAEAKKGGTFLVSELLAARYNVPSEYNLHEIMSRSSLHLGTVLSLLGRTKREQVLTQVFESLPAIGADGKPLTLLIDTELATYLSEMPVLQNMVASTIPSSWLTPQGINILLQHPVLADVLDPRDLDDAQFNQLLKWTDHKDLKKKKGTSHLEEFNDLLDSIDDARALGVTPRIYNQMFGLASRVGDHGDALLSKILAIVGSGELYDYLTGMWKAVNTPVIPAIADIADVVEKMLSSIPMDAPFHDAAMHAIYTGLSYEYVTELLEVVPGAARALSVEHYQADKYTDYVWHRLSETSLPMEFVLEQFSTSPAIGLREFCESMKAQARAFT